MREALEDRIDVDPLRLLGRLYPALILRVSCADDRYLEGLYMHVWVGTANQHGQAALGSCSRLL